MIDTHTHIFDLQFDNDIEEVISTAVTEGVQKMILPAVDSQSHKPLITIVRNHPDVCYGAIGLHPTHINDNPDWQNEIEIVKRQLETRPIDWVAIGEIGLDLYWSTDFLKEQTEAFIQQIELSSEYNLPLIIHTRNAWDEILPIVKQYGDKIRGVFHSFSGEQRHLDEILTMDNFYVGIGGTVTYKNSSLPEIMKNCPLEKMLLETDSPYLPPVPHRGKRNESSYLRYIAEKIAEIKNCTSQQVDNVTTNSAMRLFFTNFVTDQ